MNHYSYFGQGYSSYSCSLFFFSPLPSPYVLKCGQYQLDNIQIINYCQINMSADAHSQQKSILLKAYQCKIKSKFNIQEFFDIVNSDPKLSKMAEKSLFMVYLAELLLKAFISHGLKIRNFITQFDKKDVKKERKRGTGETRRRRTNKNQRGRGGKTLEQLSNQSLSNPSNVQRPRINAENRQEESANQLPPSKQKGDDSNGSKDNSSKNQLKIQLNKITEQIRGQEETFIPDVEFAPNTQFQDNSQSSSSQQSGEISNLSEKIKIFTNIKENERRGTTTRRKTGNNGNLSRQTRTKKKKFDIFDQSTFIQETRASDNDLTLNYNQTSHFDTQQVVDLDLVNHFLDNLCLQEKQLTLQLFSKQKLQVFKNVIQIEAPIINGQGNGGYDGMMPIDEGNNFQFPDYTMSQPTSAPLFQPDFFKESLEIKDTQFSFDKLVNHSTKNKSLLFYQLLWRQQNDQISLFQKNPQQFSMIKVKHK